MKKNHQPGIFENQKEKRKKKEERREGRDGGGGGGGEEKRLVFLVPNETDGGLMPSYTIVSSSSTYAFFDASDADSSSPSPTSSVKPPSPKFSAFSVIDSISQFAKAPFAHSIDS